MQRSNVRARLLQPKANERGIWWREATMYKRWGGTRHCCKLEEVGFTSTGGGIAKPRFVWIWFLLNSSVNGIHNKVPS